MAYLDVTAGTAREGGVSTAALDAGVLSADATGRALIAANFFNAATVTDKFGTDSFTNAVLLQLIQDGAFAASAATRALFATAFFDATAASDKFAANALPVDRVALRIVEAHTAGDTLLAVESGSVHTNTGASGTITIVLPAATVGQEFFFVVGAAQELRIDPNTTQTISLPSTGVAGAAGKYLVADAIGESVHLICAIAGTWAALGFTGTWSAEG